MSLINKIKGSIEDTGLTCLYDSAGDINRLLDYQSYPLAFFTLINRGGLISLNGVYREIANVVVFFVNTSTFDFDSLENEEIIKTCKTLALKWLDTLPRNGVLKATVLDTNRVYNYADSILTGYCLNLRIEELEGEGCLNPLIPVDRKCEVIVSTDEGGSVNGSGTYLIGTSCTINAIPDSEHRFSGWYVGEDLISSESTYTFTITEHGTLNIKGVFGAKRLVITTTAASTIYFVNSNGSEYTFNTFDNEGGTYVYEGDIPGFAINEIVDIKNPNSTYGTISIDASDLTSWTKIPNYNFRNSSKLVSLLLPPTITKVENYAFWDCTGLTTLVFSDSLTSIGEGAFTGCTSLESITFLSTTPPTLGYKPFETYGIITTYPLYVPDNSVNAYKTAWSSYADRIQAITE